MRRTRIAALLLGLAVALGLTLRPPQQAPSDLPAPLDREPGEQGEGFGEWRERWMDSMLVAAPGVDPRALDAAYRGERMRRAPTGASDASSGTSFPASSNSSSGW